MNAILALGRRQATSLSSIVEVSRTRSNERVPVSWDNISARSRVGGIAAIPCDTLGAARLCSQRLRPKLSQGV